MTKKWLIFIKKINSVTEIIYRNNISVLITTLLGLTVTVESTISWAFIRDFIKQHSDEPPNTIFLKSSYDFIIVGAGTAGCTLANRLTEVPSWDVLLVEAGGHEYFLKDIPIVANYLQSTHANWNYKTEPSNKYCTGFKNNQCHFPRGKVVGGSSVLNYMVYTRGAPQDYNNWAAMGNKGWSWQDVLPYFKKIENFNINEYYDPVYHSRNGYLNIEYTPYRTNKSTAWIKAAKEYGFKHGDYNGPIPSGVVSNLELTMKDGTRHSASRAYLHPIKNRNNLSLSKNTMVTKLLFNADKTAVIGVELHKFFLTLNIYAKKEVILCAGALNSPQLLMLSGIGPKEHLKQLQIPFVKHLPVGYNLMDHVATGGLTFTVEEKVNTVTLQYALTHYFSVVKYYMDEHKGPLSLPGGTEALLFANIKDWFNTTSWPDIELFFIGSGLNAEPNLKVNFNFRDDIYNQVYGPLGNKNTFMVFPMIMRPKSKGRVKLRSRDPYAAPVIVPNYFDHEGDLNKIVEGIKIAIDIAKQPALKAMGAKLYDVPIKHCLGYGHFGSTNYFKCMTRMFTFTIYHQSGTCKMGLANDQTSVVDSNLQVHGISKLRVVDASIMPYITSGHINAPVFMIAEKAADMIKKKWLKKL